MRTILLITILCACTPAFAQQAVHNYPLPAHGKHPDGTVKPLPENLYTQHLGFFCRQELKMSQKHIPVTFRVGSMDNCNRLEQKPGYR